MTASDGSITKDGFQLSEMQRALGIVAGHGALRIERLETGEWEEWLFNRTLA